MNLKRLFLLLLIGLAFSAIPALAQNKQVTGKITDEKGAPVSGASVLVKGTTLGTQTAADGTFKISVPPSATTLIVTSISYGTKDVAISGSTLNISVQSSNSTLNDVVVIGYGSARKKDLTGAVSVVTAKDFQQGAITTPDQMIAGKVAGVSVISNGGAPGAGSTIRIRGTSSVNLSNDPLIVIDGVPLSGSTIPGAASPLSLINSDDIESFTVLKDASATAIYGSRATNGVIIITTKHGKAGGLKVSFNTVNSLSTIAKKVSVLSADQFRSAVEATGDTAKIALLGNANTNWQNQIFQNAFGTTNNISLTGGIKNLPYRLSIGYQGQDGILRTDNLSKNSIALTLNPTFFNNHLKVDVNIMGSVENTRFANQGAIGAAISYDPTQPVYSGNSKFGGYHEWVDANNNLIGEIPYNPLGLLYQNYNLANPERSIGSIQLDYNFPFLPALHVKVNAAYDVSDGTGTDYIPSTAASNYNVTYPDSLGGVNNHYKSTSKNTTLEYYLNYVKDFKSIKSRLDAIAGYSYNDYLTTNYEYQNYSAARNYLSNNDSTNPYDKPENAIISFFGRASYSFNDEFYLTGSIREDGSSQFGPYGTGVTIGTIGQGGKWGAFPSGAFKWKINNEKFLKNSRVISDLDIRVGYGITGNQAVPDYAYFPSYSLAGPSAAYQFGNQYVQGYRPGGYDAGLSWEQTATTNLGLDYGFLNNRINGSLDFYQRNTSNLLISINEPAGTNFSAFINSNVGSLTNKGVEFSINAQPIRAKDLTWDVSFNVSYNKNTITSLLPGQPNGSLFGGSISGTGAQGFAFIDQVGYAINTFNLYQQIYGANGQPIEGLFNDVNRDGIINSSDAVKDHDPNADVIMGFSTNLTYKKWSAGFVLRSSINNYVYDQYLATNASLNDIIGGTVLSNVSTNYLQTQFKGNTTTQFLSDYYLYNASFLKMDNCNISYNFGKVFHSSTTLRGSLICQNVFVITKYPGIDPEVSNGPGIDNNNYPRPRIFSLGLNLNF
jgi:TonB-dependent starch-binding outer membrane protein SusC